MVCATEPPRIIILWFLATLIQLTSTSGKNSASEAKIKPHIQACYSPSKLSTSLCMDDHQSQSSSGFQIGLKTHIQH